MVNDIGQELTISLSDTWLFVLLAGCGSLRLAARLTFRSASAVQRQMRRLEGSLNLQLYDGHGRGGIELTSAGAEWLPAAEELLAAGAQAFHRAQMLRSHPQAST